MLNQVRVFNAKGQLKQVISSQQLSQIHWEKFEAREAKSGNPAYSIPTRGQQGSKKIQSHIHQWPIVFDGRELVELDKTRN